MEMSLIRIKSITLNNIKNVANGRIEVDKANTESLGASIVGIYGQNGSGKTALIGAMELFKDAISGVPIAKDIYYYIRQQSSSATIIIELLVNLDNRDYDLEYTLKIEKTSDKKAQIVSESLDYSARKTGQSPRINKTKILAIDYPVSASQIDTCFYSPENRIAEMVSVDKQVRQKLLVIQAIAKEKNTSFIFNEKLLSLLKETQTNPLHYRLLNSLIFYGRMNLFVLNKNSESSFSMNLLPLSMRLKSDTSITKSDAIPLGLGRNVTNKGAYETINKVIEQIDLLIGTIIPGLSIKIINEGTQLGPTGEEEIAFELVSDRNGVITPLRYESEGIKKILCMLSSVIAMYNDSSVFVAIDEMDSGIFEYLLGEILGIIYKTGKGQLLFTSHNMRPLEVLENSNIYFSTTNPNNKYIQFVGIKQSHNLRATLLRTIDLGGQKESVYENTSAYKIGKAFRKAGGN